jgi:phospholipid-binding lipoprotein MlaA
VRLRQGLLLLLLLLLVCPACATVASDPGNGAVAAGADAQPALSDVDPFDDEDWLLEEEDFGVRDPLQPFNRGVFGVNEAFYRGLATPISRAFEKIVPVFVQDMLQRFFDNLDEPVVFVNDVLQGAPIEAGETFGRFLLNSTVGLVGFFDIATPMGLPGHETDFGQTLAIYRVPSGPFLVLPIIGPATARDTLGVTVDLALRPDIWLLGAAYVLVATGDGLTTYRMARQRLDALRETSVDFYAALRSAYVMDRDAQLEERIEFIRRPRPVSTRCLPPPSWRRCGQTGK